MLESDFYESVKAGTPNLRWERIENSAKPGVPDTNCYRITPGSAVQVGRLKSSQKGQSSLFSVGREELVQVEFKVSSGSTLDMELFQIPWFTSAAANGSKAKILTKKNGSMLLFSCQQIPQLMRAGIIKVRGAANKSQFPSAERARLFLSIPIFKSDPPYDWRGLERCLFE